MLAGTLPELAEHYASSLCPIYRTDGGILRRDFNADASITKFEQIRYQH